MTTPAQRRGAAKAPVSRKGATFTGRGGIAPMPLPGRRVGRNPTPGTPRKVGPAGGLDLPKFASEVLANIGKAAAPLRSGPNTPISQAMRNGANPNNALKKVLRGGAKKP